MSKKIFVALATLMLMVVCGFASSTAVAADTAFDNPATVIAKNAAQTPAPQFAVIAKNAAQTPAPIFIS